MNEPIKNYLTFELTDKNINFLKTILPSNWPFSGVVLPLDSEAAAWGSTTKTNDLNETFDIS